MGKFIASTHASCRGCGMPVYPGNQVACHGPGQGVFHVNCFHTSKKTASSTGYSTWTIALRKQEADQRRAEAIKARRAQASR